jgi:hypothetical protein
MVLARPLGGIGPVDYYGVDLREFAAGAHGMLLNWTGVWLAGLFVRVCAIAGWLGLKESYMEYPKKAKNETRNSHYISVTEMSFFAHQGSSRNTRKFNKYEVVPYRPLIRLVSENRNTKEDNFIKDLYLIKDLGNGEFLNLEGYFEGYEGDYVNAVNCIEDLASRVFSGRSNQDEEMEFFKSLRVIILLKVLNHLRNPAVKVVRKSIKMAERFSRDSSPSGDCEKLINIFNSYSSDSNFLPSGLEFDLDLYRCWMRGLITLLVPNKDGSVLFDLIVDQMLCQQGMLNTEIQIKYNGKESFLMSDYGNQVIFGNNDENGSFHIRTGFAVTPCCYVNATMYCTSVFHQPEHAWVKLSKSQATDKEVSILNDMTTRDSTYVYGKVSKYPGIFVST